MPPPARAISSYGTPVTFCSYSSRAPAGERQVRVAVDEAGDDRAAARVDLHVGASASASKPAIGPRRRARSSPAPRSSPARSWRMYASPSSGGRSTCAAPLMLALIASGSGSSIGMRMPPRSAASIASG